MIIVRFVSASTEVWGAENSMISVARSIVDEETVCSLLCPPGALADVWQQQNLGEWTPLGSTGSPVARLASGFSAMLRSSEDVIVVFDLAMLNAVFLRSLIPWRKPRIVLDLHNFVDDERRRRRLSLLATRFDHAVCVSDWVRGQLRPDTAASVLPRPVEQRERAGHYHSSTAKSFGVISRLDREKEIEVALHAIRLSATQARLILRGQPGVDDSSYSSEVLALGRSLGDRFEHQGFVPNSRAFDGVDVLIVTNPREPSGRVVAESLASGIPVLAPRSGGVAEFVRSGENGFLYSDAPSLALLIDRLSNDDDLLASLRRGAMRSGAAFYPEVVGPKFRRAILGAAT